LSTESVTSDGQSIEFKLRNTQTGVQLKAILYSLINGQVLRLKINEIDPVRQRFEAKDALLSDIPHSNLIKKKKNDNGFEAKLGDNKNKVVVNASPFRVDVYSDDKLVISGNQRGLFKFEHYRPKQTGNLNLNYIFYIINKNAINLTNEPINRKANYNCKVSDRFTSLFSMVNISFKIIPQLL